MEVGRALRRRREALGYTLDDVRAATKIRLRYLQAIEEGRPEELPAPVYTRGFIRSYGNFLDLDGAALAAAWADAAAPEEPEDGTAPTPGDGAEDEARAPAAPAAAAVTPLPPPSAGGPPARWLAGEPERAPRLGLGRRRRPIVALWVVALVAIVAAAYLWQAARRGATAPGASATATTTATATTGSPGAHSATATVPATPAPPAPSLSAATTTQTAGGPLLTYRVAGASSLTVVARATARCWVRVWLDGSATYADQTLAAGHSATWHAQRQVRLRIGYPSGLDLTVDGVAVPPFRTINPVNAALVLGSPTP